MDESIGKCRNTVIITENAKESNVGDCMIDFHSHVLPGVDDGSKDIEESLEMLASLKGQGVTTVVATPHYDGRCSVEEFLQIRENAYNQLMDSVMLSPDKYPEIILGTEVLLGQYLLEIPSVDRLCIEGTKYFLAELPMGVWPSYIFNVLYYLSVKYGLNLIIAHADRYYSLFGKNNKNIFKLVKKDYIIQINTTSLSGFRGRLLFKRLVGCNAKIVLGSDCHSMTYRKPVVSSAVSYVDKKYGADFFDSTSKKILRK